jgi:hypothetical protein
MAKNTNKSDPPTGNKYLTCCITPEGEKLMNTLRERIGAANDAEVLNQSITFVLSLIEMVDRDSMIAEITKDGIIRPLIGGPK